MQLTFSILGLIGGVLCACGDVLFDLKGPHNKKLGISGNIDSNWLKMSDWRFGLSIFFAFLGDFCVALGICSLAMQMDAANHMLALITGLTGLAGCVGGLFIHSFLCVQALVYKGIMEKGSFETADHTLEKVYKQITGTFFFAYVILMIPSVTTPVAILTGALSVPKWFVLLNSIMFLAAGVLLRKLNPMRFADLPGIVMPSLGLGMLGLVGIINLL